MAQVGPNGINFTNFAVEEVSDSSLQVKSSGSTVSTFNSSGILFDNTDLDLTSTDLNSAVSELSTNMGSQTTAAGGGHLKFIYRYDNATSDSDPGDGKVRFDSTSYASMTTMFIDNKEYARKTNVRNLLLLGTGDLKIYVQRSSDNSKYALFSANGIDSTDAGYLKFTNLSLEQSGGNLSTGKDVLIVIAKEPGAQIRGVSTPAFPANSTGVYDFTYDSSTQVISWTPPKARLILTASNPTSIVTWTTEYTTTATTISTASSNTRIILDTGKVYRMTYGCQSFCTVGIGQAFYQISVYDNTTVSVISKFGEVGRTTLGGTENSSVTKFITRADIPSGTDRILFLALGSGTCDFYVTIEEV